jgi:hypothetical protein
MKSTKDVIENHILRFREGNLDGVLDDFSPDAILITPRGLLRGRSEIQNCFRICWRSLGSRAHRTLCRRQSSKAIMPTVFEWRNCRQLL